MFIRMTSNPRIFLVTVASLALIAFTTGCDRKPTPKATAEQLQKSFAKSEAPQQELVSQATTALQAGDFTGAMVTLERAVQLRPADAAQKQAVGQLILQTRLAIQQDPKLNTPQLYQAMDKLITRVHGEN